MGKSKSKQNPNLFKNPLEAVQGYGTDVVKSVAKTTTDEFDTMFADLLGLGSNSESQEKDAHNGEVEIFSSSHEKKAETHARGHVEYHHDMEKSGERASRAETQQLSRQVQEILSELKRLISSSKTMEMEFADIAVMETPPEVGEYHLNFFEWLLITIKQAREKVEDSGAWLSAVKGKNGKKGGGYWDMFKKHGTAFGMSNERSSATSVG
jgi:hypothetical protein